MDYAKLAAKAMKNDQTENLTPKYVEWTVEGQVIVGEFKAIVEIESSQNDGVYYQYMFQTDDGLVKFHMGKATDSEAGCNFVKGDIYHIEYQGKLKIGGNKTVNKFHIERIIVDGAPQKE